MFETRYKAKNINIANIISIQKKKQKVIKIDYRSIGAIEYYFDISKCTYL